MVDEWEVVTDLDQLSCGEMYYVYLPDEDMYLMEWDGNEFSCEAMLLDLTEGIPEGLQVLTHVWPEKPHPENRQTEKEEDA